MVELNSVVGVGNRLTERFEALAGRVVGVEAAPRALAAAAGAALASAVGQARNEFGVGTASLTILRDEVVQEAMEGARQAAGVAGGCGGVAPGREGR